MHLFIMLYVQKEICFKPFIFLFVKSFKLGEEVSYNKSYAAIKECNSH